MSTKSDRERIAGYYDRLVAEHGYSVQARDVSSEQGLAVRYRALSEVGELAGKDVLEVGCGFGDLGAYLAARFPAVKYSGIDLSGAMVETGRRIHPSLELKQGDVAELPASAKFDFVLAQGIFYLLGADAQRKMQTLIRCMFDHCNTGVGFCTISAWADPKQEGEFYPDPLETLAYCRTVTPWVTLRHDYHPGDFAVYMYRDAQGR
jgi:SAM-dependent methyltransferase